jgi:hypothetical protein
MSMSFDGKSMPQKHYSDKGSLLANRVLSVVPRVSSLAVRGPINAQERHRFALHRLPLRILRIGAG